MFGGKARVPLVMRTQGGGGRGNVGRNTRRAWRCGTFIRPA